MDPSDIKKLRSLTSFEALVDYLRDELDWPIEAEDIRDVTFSYDPKELGIDPAHAVKIDSIRQIRPLADAQPWGIFYVQFESKSLPVLVLRRILRSLVRTSRIGNPDRPTWKMEDLLFISAQGAVDNRSISFAHFHQKPGEQPELWTFSWDVHETHLYYIQNLNLAALRWPANEQDEVAWRAQWGQAFIVTHRYVPTTAEMLSKEMARIAKDIREAVTQIYNLEHSGGALHQLHLSLKMDLISDLNEADFADMYAQTVTYGLFAARATRSGEFKSNDATALISHTNPFLRELLQQMMDQKSLDLEELGVSELTDLLGKVNMEAILQSFGMQKRGEDPVIHFYETFMHEYDPDQKTKRGEFYTPDPVVSFIVRSVDYLLRTEFNCPDGLLSTTSTNGSFSPVILDPATGTGTFLKYVIEVIWETFYEKNKNMSAANRRVKWNRFVRESVLPRLYAFELKMSPYTIAHMKVGLALQQTGGFEFQEGERLGIYLSNTLQPAHEIARIDTPALAHEVEYANEVKNNVPVSVIIGNPPYSVNSANEGEWITSQIQKFYYPKDEIKESNPKLLLDDYIKFLYFSQLQIKQTGFGIVGFITNHGYLDNPTFRRMRQSIISNCSKIYLFDLHGNMQKKEVSPDGTKDENVFDIRQGVAICFLVIQKDKDLSSAIYRSDLYGLRKSKYEFLLTNNIKSIVWDEIQPDKPFFLFTKQDTNLKEEFYQGLSIPDIFPLNVMGIKTNNDSLLSDINKKELIKRISNLEKTEFRDEEIIEMYNLKDSNYWNTKRERNKIRGVNWRLNITPATYRPFDNRWLLYQQNLIEIGRGGAGTKVMRHMLIDNNIALVSVRQVAEGVFNHIFTTRNITECRVMVSNKGAAYLYPLYLFPEALSGKSYRQTALALGPEFDIAGKNVNLSRNAIDKFTSTLGVEYNKDRISNQPTIIGPEEIFYYIYAIAHSATYRSRYSEFLKIDFPRIPLTSNIGLFGELCALGKELVVLHLLESPLVEDPHWGTPVLFIGNEPSMPVAAGFPKYENDSVIVNSVEGFKNVPEEVWGFQIGGYQVCHKWLKDRRGRQLSSEDIAHYKKIVYALGETIRLMGEVDAAIDSAGGWPIK